MNHLHPALTFIRLWYIKPFFLQRSKKIAMLLIEYDIAVHLINLNWQLNGLMWPQLPLRVKHQKNSIYNPFSTVCAILFFISIAISYWWFIACDDQTSIKCLFDSNCLANSLHSLLEMENLRCNYSINYTIKLIDFEMISYEHWKWWEFKHFTHSLHAVLNRNNSSIEQAGGNWNQLTIPCVVHIAYPIQ